MCRLTSSIPRYGVSTDNRLYLNVRSHVMSEFAYKPSAWVPFDDVKIIERVRAIRREDIEKHSNPDFKIRVLPAEKIAHIFITDIFSRIYRSDVEDTPVVFMFPNPNPAYWQVAHLINTLKVSCRNVWVFALDEYADQDGNIAPETWEFGFFHSLLNNFYYAIDKELRPPKEQIIGPTNENCKAYSKMIDDMGGADACYTGPGWTGHLAFVEPDAPEFKAASLEEWLQMGSRIVTLSPFTLAQNSMHGSFGKSGDLAMVPPKAFTIGPRDVTGAKYRMDMSSITVHGTSTSWQRMITRLAAHGPVTPLVPTSIHQLLKTDYYISEENAKDIEPDWAKGY